MSAYGLGSRIANLFYIPVNAIGGALSAFIGQSLGAGDVEHAKNCFKEGMKLCTAISAVITIFGWLIGPHIVPLFVKDASQELLTLATEYTFYSVATAFFMGWYGILSGVFNGSGHTMVTMANDAARLWVFRFLTLYICENILHMGVESIWWSVVISNAISAAILYVLYRVGIWKKDVVRIRK